MKATYLLPTLALCALIHLSNAQPNAGRLEPITNLAQAKRVFSQFFRNEVATLDDYGNVYLGGETGGSGHCLFRLTDVHFDMEVRPREPGCADMCEERVIFHIQCRKSACIRDPWSESLFYGSAESVDELLKQSTSCRAMMFYGNVRAGQAAFDALKRIKDFFQREACMAQ